MVCDVTGGVSVRATGAGAVLMRNVNGLSVPELAITSAVCGPFSATVLTPFTELSTPPFGRYTPRLAVEPDASGLAMP